MKRLHIHILFFLAALACLAALLISVQQRDGVVAVNRTIVTPPMEGDTAPAGLVARGIALAKTANDKAAQNAYQSAMANGAPEIQQMARYNLGNLHLRQAIKMGVDDRQALPLIELAKIQYREVLANEPDHWDARFNLERALWLAPEREATKQGHEAPHTSERAATTMKVEHGDLP